MHCMQQAVFNYVQKLTLAQTQTCKHRRATSSTSPTPDANTRAMGGDPGLPVSASIPQQQPKQNVLLDIDCTADSFSCCKSP